MKLTILMPTTRFENLPQIKQIYEQAMVSLPGLQLRWRVLLVESQVVPPEARELLREPWIDVCVFDAPQRAWVWSTPFYYKINCALDSVQPDEWVWAQEDDNLAPPGIFEVWSRAIVRGRGVVVASCKRGQRQPGIKHATTTLVASPESMRPGHVDLGQYILRGDIAATYRYPDISCGDGILVQTLWQRIPQEFMFLPGTFVLFNALEPGRWDSDALQKELV